MSAMRLPLACFALLVLAAAPARAGGIVNGSFEAPTVPVGGYLNYLGGSTAITGWTVEGTGVSVVSGSFSQDGILFHAEDGKQWLDLTGDGFNSPSDGVAQNVTTVVGHAYSLSFYVGSATDDYLFFASTVNLSIDGGAITSYTNPIAPSNMLNWELFTVDFAATTTMTNVAFYNGDSVNNNNASLDNVTLNSASVPEPAAITLMAIGSAAAVIVLAFRKAGKSAQSTPVRVRTQNPAVFMLSDDVEFSLNKFLHLARTTFPAPNEKVAAYLATQEQIYRERNLHAAQRRTLRCRFLLPDQSPL
jgi:Protein of unknown function (DUF642)